MNHLTQKEALKYISKKLDEEKLIKIDEHLADCSRCVERVRALRMLRADFDDIWESWTAKSHAEAYFKLQMAGALSKAAETAESKEIRNRIKIWLEKIQSQAETTLGLIVDFSHQTADIIYDSLGDLRFPDAALQPEFAKVRHRGAIRTRGSIKTSDDVSEKRSKISVISEGPPQATIDIDVSEGKVNVQFDVQGEPIPLVLLVPISKEKKALIEVPKRKEGYLSADFDNVSDDEYLLLIEPIKF
jgi:hypothetical protein